MATTIYAEDGINVHKFWGGECRGGCYQIDLVHPDVQLRREHLKKFVLAMLDELMEAEG